MGLVERVVLRLLHVLPELLGDLRGRPRSRRQPAMNLSLQRRHQRVDLLPDRLAEIVRLGRREAGQLLGDLHVLLLVDADAVRRLGDRPQPLVRERHLLLPRLALARRRGCSPSGPGRNSATSAIRSSNSVGFTCRSASRIPDDSNWNTPVDSPRAEHLVGLRVVERHARRSPTLADERDRLVDHVEVAQAEEVHLQQAERLDVLHRELRHDLLVAALLLQRHVLDERPVADDDAGGVDRVLPDEPLERLREVDDLADHLVRVVGLPQLGARLQAVVEVDLRALGDRLRDPVDDAVRDVEHAPGVANGGPRGHRPERDDLRDPIAPVLLGDVVDDLVASVDGEVDVDVGHRSCGPGSGSARRAGRTRSGRCR